MKAPKSIPENMLLALEHIERFLADTEKQEAKKNG